jgi:heat-inducible transcriptional repressor
MPRRTKDTITIEMLTERERVVLVSVINDYVETAQPVGSRKLVKKYMPDISPATVRNTMSDLEDKGLLMQPHTSAGRVPTDKAYRLYVDHLLRVQLLTRGEMTRIETELQPEQQMAAQLVSKAAQVLSILTKELGVGLVPKLEEGILTKIDLVGISLNRVLLIMTVKSGLVKSIFFEIDEEISPEDLHATASILNEKLAGLKLKEIKQTISSRLRDADKTKSELLNVFIESADELFKFSDQDSQIMLGKASGLASQPEFADGGKLKSLIELTESRSLISSIMSSRSKSDGLLISIGKEHGSKDLEDFSIITSNYTVGSLKGTIGVIGPTRMPYNKLVAMVDYTSKFITSILSDSS